MDGKLLDLLKREEALWDNFTRREEYDPPALDKFQRFPYWMSHHPDIFEPEVSRFLVMNGLELEYPDDKRFAICLTHDVDVVRYPRLYTAMEAAECFKAGRIKEAIKRARYFRPKWSPFWNFKFIMDLEANFNAQSTFFFMAIEDDDSDFDYRIEDLGSELGSIRDLGWDVGLHGGQEAYYDIDKMKREKRRLEEVLGSDVAGYRSHFLRFRAPDTWKLLEAAGLKYDSSLGYADCVGFRNGMCHPFQPVDRRGDVVDILEIPLIVMDRALLKYMGLDAAAAWKVTKMLIDRVKECRGVITILWHNNSMSGESLKLYKRILEYGRQMDAWMTSCEGIAKLKEVA